LARASPRSAARALARATPRKWPGPNPLLTSKARTGKNRAAIAMSPHEGVGLHAHEIAGPARARVV